MININREEIIERLIDAKFGSKRQFAESIGLPATTLQSILKRGVGKASIDNVVKICRGLGITIEDLEKMAENGIEEDIKEEDRIKTIADFFNITVDDLLNRTDSDKLTKEEESFYNDIGKLNIEELKEKHILEIDNRLETEEEINAIIAFVRMMRNSK